MQVTIDEFALHASARLSQIGEYDAALRIIKAALSWMHATTEEAKDQAIADMIEPIRALENHPEFREKQSEEERD